MLWWLFLQIQWQLMTINTRKPSNAEYWSNVWSIECRERSIVPLFHYFVVLKCYPTKRIKSLFIGWRHIVVKQTNLVYRQLSQSFIILFTIYRSSFCCLYFIILFTICRSSIRCLHSFCRDDRLMNPTTPIPPKKFVNFWSLDVACLIFWMHPPHFARCTL